MSRVIRFFDKIDESYVGEAQLPEIPLVKLQEAFKVPTENPMYDSFPIGEEQTRFLNHVVKIEIDLSKYDYFLEFDE